MKQIAFIPKHYDSHKSLFSGNYEKFPEKNNETIPVTVDGQSYKIDLMTALFFNNAKGISSWLSHNHLKSYKPRPFIDCALSRKSGHPKFSLFSLCETLDEVEELLVFFKKVGYVSYSKFSIEFIQKNPSLRGRSFFLKDYLSSSPGNINYIDIIDLFQLADTFFFNKNTPSATILYFISEANQMALSLGAHFSQNNAPQANVDFLLSPQTIIDRLQKNPALASSLPPILKLLLLLLEAENFEPELSESDVEILCELIYSEYQRAVPETMREALIKKLVDLYPKLFFKHLPFKAGETFWEDLQLIETTSAYDEAHKVYFIIKMMERGEEIPDDVLESIPTELLKQALDEDFIKRSPRKNATLFSNVFQLVHEGKLSQEFIESLESLNDTDCIAYFFQSWGSTPLYEYLMNRPAFIPYLFEQLARANHSTPWDLPVMEKAQSRRILKSKYFAQADRTIKMTLLCDFGHLLRTQELLEICQKLLPFSFELLDEVITSHKDNTEHRRTYGRPLKALLETNEALANAYYLSGLRDTNYAYRVEWLHVAGFKININQIENTLEETKISSQERLELKQVLISVSQNLVRNKFRDLPPHPLDEPLKSTLLALFDRHHSNVTRKIPELRDLDPFELCVMALFYRLNIAESHQNVVLFCEHIRTQKELPASMTDLDVLKHELNCLIEKSSNERITLNWLIKADPEMCEALFKIYAWQSYDSRYALTANSPLHDMIEQGMNASSIERDAAAASLLNHQQVTCLSKKVEGLERQLAAMQESMQRQTELLLQLVNPTKNEEAQSTHKPGFFG